MLLLHTTGERRASHRRRVTAAGYEHAVARAVRGPTSPLTAEVAVDRRAVADSAERLLAIATALRSERELPADGVAAARALLVDGASPLYVDGDRLPHALLGVETALGLR